MEDIDLLSDTLTVPTNSTTDTVQTPLALATTLGCLLANHVILRHTAPYIPVRGLLATAATCKTLRSIINDNPDPWRHLDLSTIKSAVLDTSPIDVGGMSWRAERMDEALSEDDFYAGPLRGIFNKLHNKRILQFVHILVLDGLSVPADLVREILADDRFNVRILSIREAKHLNQGKLQQLLRYLVRPTRPENTPKLRALYVFGPTDASKSITMDSVGNGPPLGGGVTVSEGAQIGAEWNHRSSAALTSHLSDEEKRWYGCSGRAMKRPQSDWPDTLQACRGLITFDAVLCRGPRHDITKVSSREFLQPAIATVALGPSGCDSCGSSPEGAASFNSSPEYTLPLLSPPPLHASTVRAAQRPDQASTPVLVNDAAGMSAGARRLDNAESAPSLAHGYPRLLLRCEDCLRGRWCERCNRWWCEDCYHEPVSRSHLRTDLQQVELREELRQNGWEGEHVDSSVRASGSPVKVYSKLCVERCLVSEMMSGAGSNGMWG